MLPFNGDNMDIDRNEAPINGVKWYTKIPHIFLQEAGISDKDLTLGTLVRMCERLRTTNEEVSAKLKSELERSTNFNKELIMPEAKHRSVAKESGETVKMFREDISRVRVKL